ncbi:hypothetical protein BGY98DRAFT_1026893, partial [Russula aff. rugulosa BPL654]
MHGVGVPASGSQSHRHSHHIVAEMGTAASATASNIAGLSVQTAEMKVQCIDKADVPLIRKRTNISLCLVSLSDGLAGYPFPLYNTRGFNQNPCPKPSQPGYEL